MTLEPENSPRLDFEFCGLRFDSPLVLLSGCVGFGEEYTRIEGFSNRDVGAICLKGTTFEARLGNPAHRVAETSAGMLNAIGLQNPGAAAVVRDYLPRLDFAQTRFIANVSGSTVEEYEAVTRIFDDSPIDAMEINISCPNVKEGGVAFGNDPDMSARVVAACRRATSKPLITKLSPNQTDIVNNARHCIDAGTDAFAVINTVMGMAIDVERREPVIGNNQGGLSGPNATDAIEFLIAGASAVGIGTALFYEPLICAQINAGISDYLARHDYASVTDIIGSLRLHGG
jgi:dihydroorotate dehydrogenase (NAD+) catalytic subunit